MWAERTAADIGTLTHLLIADLVANPDGPPLTERTRQLVGSRPIPGVRAASARMAVGSAAGTYLRRFRPLTATLAGVEVDLGVAIADLVWEHNGKIAIDEIKSGSGDLGSSELRSQLRRLIQGGSSRWGDQFVGVRLVPIACASNTCFVTERDGRFLSRPAPRWMAVR